MELLKHEFPPVPWIVPGLITTGLVILLGAPKLGKSWIALQIGIGVALGDYVLGSIKVDRYHVLILALEDIPRRLQTRLQKLGADNVDNLAIATEWPAGAEGLRWLVSYIENSPEIKLCVIDTWARFLPTQDGNDYGEVTRAAAKLKEVADRHDVAIVAIHHTRKGGADDFVESALGSTGLTAVADTTMVLRRGRGNRDATLSITGRDVEEQEYAVSFNPETGAWTLSGTVKEVQESTSRQQIYDLLRDEGAQGPKAIADALGKNRSTVKTLLRRMESDCVITGMSGVYTVAETVNPVDRKPEGNPGSGLQFTRSTVSQPTEGTKQQQLNDEAEASDFGIF